MERNTSANVIRRRRAPALLLAGASILAGCNRPAPPAPPAPPPSPAHASHAGHSPQPTVTPRVPAHHASVEDARPIPATLDPGQFETPYVIKAYRVAQRIPEVIAQQPCYCYCDDGFGHRSLLDCYVTDHSASCLVCLKEGLLADKMHRAGSSPADIRSAIVRGDWMQIKLDE
ncbi:MAG TPA: CYCXC family (seleno)protein [Blastocatellia bacterium]|nr:CYCXC family (seleno)protein [Blastocatellia bacterium]